MAALDPHMAAMDIVDVLDHALASLDQLESSLPRGSDDGVDAGVLSACVRDKLDTLNRTSLRLVESATGD